VIGLLAVSSIAQANQPGDTLQFVGSGANGACAVEIRIGSGHILYVHEELLDNVKLFTTFNNDRHFANDSEALGIPKIMVMKKSLLGARHFIYEYNHSNPGGASARSPLRNLCNFRGTRSIGCSRRPPKLLRAIRFLVTKAASSSAASLGLYPPQNFLAPWKIFISRT
jgi:hypothetical protein